MSTVEVRVQNLTCHSCVASFPRNSFMHVCSSGLGVVFAESLSPCINGHLFPRIFSKYKADVSGRGLQIAVLCSSLFPLSVLFYRCDFEARSLGCVRSVVGWRIGSSRQRYSSILRRLNCRLGGDCLTLTPLWQARKLCPNHGKVRYWTLAKVGPRSEPLLNLTHVPFIISFSFELLSLLQPRTDIAMECWLYRRSETPNMTGSSVPSSSDCVSFSCSETVTDTFVACRRP